MSRPTTSVTRERQRQNGDRSTLDAVLDSTPLATVAFLRDGHPVALPVGFARLGDELVIHGSTGSPWLAELAAGAAVSVCVTLLDAITVARSGFESSFRYRSAVLFGRFRSVVDEEKDRCLTGLIDAFIPGRAAELRAGTARELAATLVLALPIGTDNWSLKIADGWPTDGPEDVAAGGWAGVVPIVTTYGEPLRAPDCAPAVRVPPSVAAMTGTVSGTHRR
ncbi:MAG: pyridoxamine 5'-phosphate oxidase family protein [Mycobacterium sp.]